jgi:hypothetical protein
MATVHRVLQGKGGVGKSLVAALLTQFLRSKGRDVMGIDTDPLNATFAGFKSLGASRLDIMEGNEIDSRRFDALVELVSKAKDDVVIDNGSTAFISLSDYLLSNGVPEVLRDLGHELVIHTIVTGGQAARDTLANFKLMVEQFRGTRLVVWLNPFWGTVELEGKPFEALKVYLDNRDAVDGLVELPVLKKETHGRDLSDLLNRRQTFGEAAADEKLGIMVRQRLVMVQRDIFGRIERAGVASYADA